MMPTPFRRTPIAVALQAASLLVVASAIFGILISDITQHRAEVARAEAPSEVQLLSP